MSSNPVCCQVIREATYTPPPNVWFTFDYDQKVVDVGNCFDLAANHYRVSAGGFYLVTTSFVFSNTSNNKPGYAADITLRNSANTANVRSWRIMQTQSVDIGTFYSGGGTTLVEAEEGQLIRVDFISFSHSAANLSFFTSPGTTLFNYLQIVKLPDYQAQQGSFFYSAPELLG